MPSRWQTHEWERYIAARCAEEGLVPLANVEDRDTQAEIDIYCLRFETDRVRKATIECKFPSPDSTAIYCSKGVAETYHAEHAVLATCGRTLGDSQVGACLKSGVSLLSRHHSAYGGVPNTVLDVPVDASVSLQPCGRAVVSTLRCFYALEQRAIDAAGNSALARMVRKGCRAVRETVLEKDPFLRLAKLTQLHTARPRISQDCAWEERLGYDRRNALQNAYGHNGGTYTQSALMLQTLGRVFALVTLAECAFEEQCARNEGWGDLTPRLQGIVEWLTKQELKQLLAPFVLRLVFVHGGLMPDMYQQEIRADIAQAIGTDTATIDKLIELANHVYSVASENDRLKFIRHPEKSDLPFHTVALCPFALKGVGVRYIAQTYDPSVASRHPYYADWAAALQETEESCRSHEGGAEQESS